MDRTSLQSKKFWGLILLALGIYGILNNFFDFNFFSMSHLWPLFVLIPGLAFEYCYFSTRRAPGVLVPGGILTTLGLLFLFETSTHWFFSAYTWPVYILAPAIGLFQLYLYGGRCKGLLIPVGILTTVAVTCFSSTVLGHFFFFINGSIVWPVALVLIGLFILLGKSDSTKHM